MVPDSSRLVEVPREGQGFAGKRFLAPLPFLILCDWNVAVRLEWQQPFCHHESISGKGKALEVFEARCVPTYYNI